MAQETHGGSCQIGKPSGYGVTVKGSTGLEPKYVNEWLAKRLAVFFTQRGVTDHSIKASGSATPFDDRLRVGLLHFDLQPADSGPPCVVVGVATDIIVIKRINKSSKPDKFENYMALFQRKAPEVFIPTADLSSEERRYKDNNISFHRDFFVVELFDLTDSAALHRLVTIPMKEMILGQ